jgi:hypothetical protein
MLQVVWAIVSTVSFVVFVFTLVSSSHAAGRARLFGLFHPLLAPAPSPLQRRLLGIKTPVIPRLYVFFLFLFFSISFFKSFTEIFSWVPKDFGRYDEDGFFISNVETLAVPFCVLAAVWMISVCSEHARQWGCEDRDAPDLH